MSRYTTEVRFICESAAGLIESSGFDDVDSIIEDAAPNVFNFDFPIWDESYRLALEKKILRHYYTREICAETVGLWKLWLSDRLNMIMPYYNKLYETTILEFNPLYDVDVTREHTGESSGTSSGTESRNSAGTSNSTETATGGGTVTDSGSRISRNGNSNDWKLFSDTPQGGITGVANASIIQDSSLADYAYLTTAENDLHSGSETVEGQGSNTRTRNTTDTNTKRIENTGTSSGTTSGTVSNVDEYVERVFGKQGSKSYSNMLKEFRETIVNIDSMIIDELEDLFFKLWD